MRRRMTACLAAVLVSALGGCGTVVNCTSVNGPPPKQIYGGVKQDARNGSEHLTEAFSGPAPSFTQVPQMPSPGKDLMSKSFCGACGVCMLVVDLPISAVADTLTLPVTIPAALKKKKDTRAHKPRPRPAQAAAQTLTPQ